MSFVLLCGAKAGSQARGGRSLVFTFNCSIYPWKRPRTGPGHPGGDVWWCLSVYTVFGMGLNLGPDFLPIVSSQICVFKNTSM